MEKIKNFLFILLISIIIIPNVSAATTKNGVTITPNSDANDDSVEVSCTYSNGYEVGFYKLDKNDTEAEANLEGGNYGLADGFLPNKTEDYLKKERFLNDNYEYDCPTFAYGTANEDGSNFVPVGFGNVGDTIDGNYVITGLNTFKSYCKGACNGEQNATNSDDWVCNYTGTDGSEIQTKYDGTYSITFPDKSTAEVGQYEISNSCQDIYYNPHIGEANFMTIIYNISNIGDTDELKKLYDLICADENSKVGEYYCVGNCKYPDNKNVSCKDLKEKLDKAQGSSTSQKTENDIDLTEMCNENGVKRGLKLVGTLILIAKIIIPILLIIMGSIDFGKAVVSSDNDAVSKATKKFATRIIAGISIFLLPTLVNFVFDLLPINNGFDECQKCVMHPNECDTTSNSD